MVWAQTLLSVLAVGLTSLVGVFGLSLDEARLRRLSTTLIGFAVGALLGDAFLHLMPQAFESAGKLATSASMLGGVLLFFLAEKLLRHEHGPLYQRAHPNGVGKPELAVINLVGDGVHNFIDGALIAASWQDSAGLGLSTTVAVLLHELPQELGDFGVLIRSGLSVKRALVLNLASGGLAVVGAVLTLVWGAAVGRHLTQVLVPFTAGGFLYIAMASLIPELQHDRTMKGFFTQFAMIGLGLAVMGALLIAE